MKILPPLAHPSNTLILTTQQLYQLVRDEKTLGEHVFSLTKLPFHRGSMQHLVDVMLTNRSHEDPIYLSHPVYTYNVRRGLTFHFKQDQLQGILRKGLIKFYDIEPHMLKDELIHFDELENDAATRYILYSPYQCLLSHRPIKLYKLRKANGENAQISYSKSLDSWIIGSKNYAIMVKDINDINYYNSAPHKVKMQKRMAIEIAETWLRMLKEIQSVDDLKNMIGDKTLLGEYIGSKEHSHLVDYGAKSIVFYAYVENESPFTCVDPNKAISFMKKYHIPTVETELIGEYDKWPCLRKKILEIMINIYRADIDTEQEGIILYFSDSENTLSMSKVKTIDYTFLRELREALTNYIGTKDIELQSYLAAFSKKNEEILNKTIIRAVEIYNNINGAAKAMSTPEAYKLLPRSEEAYGAIINKAFSYVIENKLSGKEIVSHYTDIVSNQIT